MLRITWQDRMFSEFPFWLGLEISTGFGCLVALARRLEERGVE